MGTRLAGARLAPEIRRFRRKVKGVAAKHVDLRRATSAAPRARPGRALLAVLRSERREADLLRRPLGDPRLRDRGWIRSGSRRLKLRSGAIVRRAHVGRRGRARGRGDEAGDGEELVELHGSPDCKPRTIPLTLTPSPAPAPAPAPPPAPAPALTPRARERERAPPHPLARARPPRPALANANAPPLARALARASRPRPPQRVPHLNCAAPGATAPSRIAGSVSSTT